MPGWSWLAPLATVTVEGALAEVELQLEAARRKARLDISKGRKPIAAFRPVWRLKERKAALLAQREFPEYKVYYDAKVVGIELPNGRFESLRVGRSQFPTRTWDYVIVQLDPNLPDHVTYAKPVELKSGGAHTPRTAATRLSAGPIVSSIAGGLSGDGTVAEFRSGSDVARQLRKDRRLRRRRGRLEVEARDPVTDKPATIKAANNVIDQTSLATYESAPETVRGTTATSRGTGGAIGNRGGSGPPSGQGTGARAAGPAPGPPARVRARRRRTAVALERLRARVRRAAVRHAIRTAAASGGTGRAGTLRGLGRGAVRGGVALGKALLLDLAVGFVIGAVIAESDRRNAERAAERAVQKIEDGLVELYFAREAWMRDTLRRNPGTRFYYVATLHYDVVPGQDGGADRVYGPFVSGETYRMYGGRGDEVRVPGFRIDTQPAPPGRHQYESVVSIDVNYVDLSAIPLAGVWRAYGRTSTGLITEVDRGLELTISPGHGGGLTVTPRPGPGLAVTVTEVRYSAERQVLTFEYHFPDLKHLSHDVTLVLTEPYLLEGEETENWTGGGTEPLLLRRVGTADGGRFLGAPARPGDTPPAVRQRR